MADDGRLSALAKRLAIDAGVDWPSLGEDEQDAWHEAAIAQVRSSGADARGADDRPDLGNSRRGRRVGT
jgi:hypothetical protein